MNILFVLYAFCCWLCLAPSKTDGAQELCGLSSTRVNLDNDESEFGEIPWMAAVLLRTPLGYEPVGGGAILSPGVVVTVAHIFSHRKTSEVVVRAGEWDSMSRTEVYDYQDRLVDEIIVHRNYDEVGASNNIALLILAEAFQYKFHIRPICLPSAAMNFTGIDCVVSGWGVERFQDELMSRIMKKIKVPYVSREVCERKLRFNTNLGINFCLHKSIICAGGRSGKDTCTRDGGSPLACPIDGRFMLVGLVSWGWGCGRPNVPGAYTNTQHLLPWIIEQLLTHKMP